MSLKVWLPLDGDLRNNGTYELPVTTFNTLTYYDGKIGQCGKGMLGWHLPEDILGNEWTIALWFNSPTAFDDYNNVLFCKNIKTSTDGQIYFSIYSNNALNIGVNGTSTSLKYSYSFSLDTWYHVAATYDGTTVSLYLNGNFVASKVVTTAKPEGTVNMMIDARSSNDTGTQWWGGYEKKYNDVRIYDNCLSAAEVREIAQGLVLHYKLDGFLGGTNDNLFYNANFNNGLSHWGGVNSSTCSIVKKDDINTITATKGTSDNLICQTSKCYHTANTTETLTFSCDIYSELEGTFKGNAWIASSGWKGIGSFLWNSTTIVPGWNHIYGTINISSSVAYSGNIIISVGFSNTTFYMAHPKLEYGKKATNWTLNSDETGIDTTIVTDSSGYGHNGTIVGSAVPAVDTARYAVSMHMDGTGVITTSSPGADIRTLSCWVKTTKNKSTSQMLVADSSSNMCISFYAGTIIGVFGATRSTGSRCTLGTSYKENDWNHIVVVKTSDDGKRDIYCNGEKLTPAADNYWNATAGFFIGNRNASGSGNTPFFGYISDVRAYCTQLLDKDIKLLYNTSSRIDNLGNIHAYELEETNSQNKILKTGIIKSANFFEDLYYDKIAHIGKQMNDNILHPNDLEVITTNNSSIKTGSLGFIPKETIQTLAGKTLIFSYDVCTLGERLSEVNGDTAHNKVRYGIHGAMSYVNANGTSDTHYPFASYLTYSGNSKHIIQTWTIPTNYQSYNNLSFSVQNFDAPSNNNNNTWFIKNVRLEIQENTINGWISGTNLIEI